MSDHPHPYRAFSSDGHSARWRAGTIGASSADNDSTGADEVLTLAWDNEAWTASGLVEREQVQYVVRISPTWQVRQFLLFRDMDEPDLWIGTDGNGRWGEMNGAHREELDGCVDIELACTPFTHTIPIRRLPLPVGNSADITVASIDVETLDVQPVRRRYTRLDTHRWQVTQLDTGESTEFDVDEFGLPTDIGDVASLGFRRVT